MSDEEILEGVVLPGPPSPFSRVEFSPSEVAQLEELTRQPDDLA